MHVDFSEHQVATCAENVDNDISMTGSQRIDERSVQPHMDRLSARGCERYTSRPLEAEDTLQNHSENDMGKVYLPTAHLLKGANQTPTVR